MLIQVFSQKKEKSNLYWGQVTFFEWQCYIHYNKTDVAAKQIKITNFRQNSRLQMNIVRLEN
ncbi:hypothetical protein BK754_16250 [Bacillus thuringiensis serovar subtoxicus]|uniref:Uncharacterized protein n=2 Tax=Bacillus thuringiensis TaxID=1428 RepID=A0A9X6FJW1_BACTU|nr:hypothetical protein BK754_16250 [Bacillus thuringiensis serovar subtoxicus]